MIDLETKRKRIETGVKVAALLGVCAILAPFTYAILGGLGALIVCLTAVNLAPWFGHKLANWRLKALKAEAAANPIETLENQYKARDEALRKTRENLQEFSGAVQTLRDKIEQHNRTYPGSPSPFQKQYDMMVARKEFRGRKYKEAKAALEEFAKVIEITRSQWETALLLAKAQKLDNVGEDFISKMMKDVALDTVTSTMNTAFAEMEVSMLDDDNGDVKELAVVTNQTRQATKLPPEQAAILELQPKRR